MGRLGQQAASQLLVQGNCRTRIAWSCSCCAFSATKAITADPRSNYVVITASHIQHPPFYIYRLANSSRQHQPRQHRAKVMRQPHHRCAAAPRPPLLPPLFSVLLFCAVLAPALAASSAAADGGASGKKPAVRRRGLLQQETTAPDQQGQQQQPQQQADDGAGDAANSSSRALPAAPRPPCCSALPPGYPHPGVPVVVIDTRGAKVPDDKSRVVGSMCTCGAPGERLCAWLAGWVAGRVVGA
jgi:hypothetical protein